MSLETYLALLAFLFPLAFSPGPGNAFFAGIGASRGIRAAVPALAGYHIATFAVTAAVGLGMGVTILNEPIVARTLAAVGGLYVLWLAFQFIRSARLKTRGGQEAVLTEQARVGFWPGMVVLLLNPKAYYIIAVMFTQFLRPPFNDDVTTVIAITAIFTINNLVAFVVWTLGGGALAMLFRSERSKRWIDYLFAVTLIAVAIWMAVPLFAPA